METEEVPIEIKCENLMNIVVESRKRFGKMCIEYDQKTSQMENTMLNFRLETFSNIKFKPKINIHSVDNDDMKEIDDFSVELVELNKRFEQLRKKVKNTQEVVIQLKSDTVGRRLREPLDTDIILDKIKRKNIT